MDDKTKKREIRTVDCRLAVREQEGSQEGESRTITGTAIVFNAESQVLDDWGERFREVILPEAVTMEFLNTQDVKMNMLHQRDLTIARCNKGQGSLRMSVDQVGVHFEFEAPKCDIGDRCLEMVRRGDYSGCSFEFLPKDYEVERKEGADGVDDVTIRHKSFEWLGALTIGLDPAYTQTTVNAREIGVKREDEDDDPKGEDGNDFGTTDNAEAPKDAEGKTDGISEDYDDETLEENAEDNAEGAETPKVEEDDEQEQKEREIVSVARANRNRVRLMGRDIEDIII